MSIPIILSKIQRPPTRLDLIARPRLLARLQMGLNHKLTLVSAPAGFGKTTLISSWLDSLAQSNLPQVAWVSLDEGDNDPVRFWTYVLAALRTVQPEVGQTVEKLLNSSELPSFEFILTSLINDIHRQVATTQQIELILDDYHIIKDHIIHELVTFLLDHLPSQLRIVIISRSDPPLPVARLRARNQLNELRTQELRFTSAEVAAFLNQAMGLQLSPANISALEARTEGWIAGLQLAALSIQGREDIEEFIANFTGSHQYVLDYLVQEVFEQQSQAVQQFLLQTSILDQLSGSLCDAVTGDENGQAMLEHLAAANLFVTSQDDQRQWYRYHRLFSDLLRHKLQQTDIDVAELHLRASEWYEQESFTENAIEYALLAQDYDRTGHLIQLNMKDIFHQGKKSLLLAWLDTFPEKWFHSQPVMYLAYAWTLFVNGKFEASKQRLTQAEALLMINGEHDETYVDQLQNLPYTVNIKGLILTLRGQLNVMHGQTEQGILQLETGLTQLSDDPPGLKSYVMHQLRVALWVNGDFEAAEDISSHFQTENQLSNDTTTIIALLNQAERHAHRGQLKQSAALYQRLLQVIQGQEPEVFFPMSVVHADLGIILYEWNDLDEAEYHCRKGIEYGSRGLGTVRGVSAGYFGLIQVLRAKDDLAEASRLADEMEALLQEVDLGFHLPLSNVMRIPLWIAQNDLATLRKKLPIYQTTSLPKIALQVAKLAALVAQRHLALNEIDEVAAIASAMLHSSDNQYIENRINSLVLLALVHQAKEDLPQALNHLTEALALAEPDGYIRTFIDFGPPMIALLHELLAVRSQNESNQRPTVAYIQALIEVAQPTTQPLPPPPTPAASTSTLIEPLTDREVEVLQLIAKGYTNREIAQKLYLSPGTVKLHAHNIYGKLAVNNRTQAVAKAKTVGVLPPD